MQGVGQHDLISRKVVIYIYHGNDSHPFAEQKELQLVAWWMQGVYNDSVLPWCMCLCLFAIPVIFQNIWSKEHGMACSACRKASTYLCGVSLKELGKFAVFPCQSQIVVCGMFKELHILDSCALLLTLLKAHPDHCPLAIFSSANKWSYNHEISA